MTSFAPALVLKGSFGLSPKGKKIRNTLIGIQFMASFALIIGASFIYMQNQFIQKSPLGYDKDNLIVANVDINEAFINKLKSFPGIEEITFGENLLSSSDDMYMGWGRPFKGGNINFKVFPVHYTFLKTMGIDIIEGRDFRQKDSNTQNGVFIFNESAKNKYDLKLGEYVNAVRGDGEIIGFVHDIKYASFRRTVEPMAFYIWGAENWGSQPRCHYIKLNASADRNVAMSYIRSTLKEIFPRWHKFFEVRFFDEVLQRLYEKETALGLLISIFSIIAIFISIVGVFGLVVFDSECRRKEIGICKIHGASTKSIIFMFNKSYFRILAFCFIIATPIAWFAVHQWLQNFAYKTPMYLWVYLLAFVVVGLITACTVTFQNWRVANENPVKSIKTE